MEILHNPEHGNSLNALSTMYPCSLSFIQESYTTESRTSTYYGIVVSGVVEITTPGFSTRANQGTFFCLPGEFEINPKGNVVLIERLGYLGVPIIGSIEKQGRLTYIDGCSDTVLVSPPRFGDPVLNHLHFPPGIVQTQHTHPSIRMGVIIRGKGIAFSLNSNGEADWTHELESGSVFLLHAHSKHSFRTDVSGSTMDVIAFHPDSDWGPQDGLHPMLNRTYLNSN